MKKKVLAVGLAVTITFTGLISPIHTYAEKNLKDIRDERSEIKKELSEGEKKVASIMDEIKEINAELSVLEQSLKENEKALQEVNNEVEEVEKEIEVLERKIEERFEILSERAKSYQQSGGNITYLEVILGAKSFSDFISRVHAVTQISDSDAVIIEEQIREQQLVEEKLVELEDLQAELEEMEELIIEQQKTAKKLKEELDEKQTKLKESMKKLKKKDRTLATKEAEMLAESDVVIVNTSNDSNAMLGWPTSGGYISSTFGQRWGKMHKGIDIARTDRSTSPPIAAAESGTVERAGDSGNGYGNMVIINHGNGLKTLYAHMSSLNVKVGQKVERGQKLGVMGATGNSTGIHLHFEVHKNGSPKNPIAYLR
ncbi:MAG TPA: peptidoglycan DD-metalloendopeptidase family protein [Pseudogracilibacillus sp.]|nr:peptidoglycan DD-metalloendopeptidase family protein [Pseudogracilibacillus sp.]